MAIELPNITLPNLGGLLPNTGTPLPSKAVNEANDRLAKDERIRLSEAIERYTEWRGEDARIGKAVTLAESGGRARVYNGICCVGLLQINLNHAGEMGTPSDGSVNGKFHRWLENPGNNLRFGYALWKKMGGRWDAPGVVGTWEVLANGSFQKFLNSSSDPYVTISRKTLTGELGDVAGDVVDKALGPIDEFVGSLLSADVWFRIAKFGGGAFLIILGGATISVIALNKGMKSPVGRVASNVIPAGRAVNVARAVGR